MTSTVVLSAAHTCRFCRLAIVQKYLPCYGQSWVLADEDDSDGICQASCDGAHHPNEAA
jgi:hypothetical protein